MNRTWSTEDLALLAQRWPVDPQHEVAAALGRNLGAVKQQASRLGIRKRSPALSPENEVRLRALDAQRLPRREIADQLDLPYWLVKVACERLGLRGRSHEERALSGPDHPSWRGGNTKPQLYWSAEWFAARSEALDRDGYCCQEIGCGLFVPSGRGLDVHHVIPYRFTQDNRLRNLLTLCHPCHMRRPEHHWHEPPATTGEML